MRRIFLKLLLLIALLGGLIFNPLSTKALAQNYEPCNTANPNYCTECRDESKRDFAKCGEIDYRGVNVLKERPVMREEWGVIFDNPDMDYKNNLALFSVDLCNEEVAKRKNGRIEVFFSGFKGENQKRVTFESNEKDFTLNPFWTLDRKIGYLKIREDKSNNFEYHFYVVDKDGKNKLEVSRDELRNLYIASHGNAPKW